MALGVAVVGAGFAGLSAALSLARRLRARVRVFEARGPGEGSHLEHVGLWSPALGVLDVLGVLGRLDSSELEFVKESSYRAVSGHTLAQPATPLGSWERGNAQDTVRSSPTSLT